MSLHLLLIQDPPTIVAGGESGGGAGGSFEPGMGSFIRGARKDWGDPL